MSIYICGYRRVLFLLGEEGGKGETNVQITRNHSPERALANVVVGDFSFYKDQTEKLLLYEKHDVKEYWIVNPDAKYVMIYRLSIPDPFCFQTKCINQDVTPSPVHALPSP